MTLPSLLFIKEISKQPWSAYLIIPCPSSLSAKADYISLLLVNSISFAWVLRRIVGNENFHLPKTLDTFDQVNKNEGRISSLTNNKFFLHYPWALWPSNIVVCLQNKLQFYHKCTVVITLLSGCPCILPTAWTHLLSYLTHSSDRKICSAVIQPSKTVFAGIM